MLQFLALQWGIIIPTCILLIVEMVVLMVERFLKRKVAVLIEDLRHFVNPATEVNCNSVNETQATEVTVINETQVKDEVVEDVKSLIAWRDAVVSCLKDFDKRIDYLENQA